MSVYLIETREDMIKTAKLSQQQRNQRANKIKKRIWKQTLDEEIPESFKAITNKWKKETIKLYPN